MTANNYNLNLIEKLSAISIELSAEKNIHKLLELILNESIKITGSDAGSIYIIEERDDERKLVFKYTNNTSMNFPFKEFAMPINTNSISGACAVTGNIYNFKSMDETVEVLGFHHNKSFDESYGYETCNMLVIPLKNYTNEIIGVLQLINKKKDPTHKFIAYSGHYCEYITPYLELEEKIISALASQAAILIERSVLFQDIETLLQSFIETLVTALDSRDPITAGHSKRVTEYALRLARTLNRIDYGPYKDFMFSEDQIKELYIAGLLHDVGKIGVREYVLMKRNKLSDEGIENLRMRIQWLRTLLELKTLNQTLTLAEKELQPKTGFYLETLETINTSGFLKDDMKLVLDEIYAIRFTDLEGKEYPLLTESEYINLSVQRGNLTGPERQEISDHVVHTFNILSGIHWTKTLTQVPRIASDHHEKPNGKGYPDGRTEEQLELRSRILAIADIFDALTAKDRPYKPAIPIDKSLQILQEEADNRGLDPALVEIFKTEKAYEEVTENEN